MIMSHPNALSSRMFWLLGLMVTSAAVQIFSVDPVLAQETGQLIRFIEDAVPANHEQVSHIDQQYDSEAVRFALMTEPVTPLPVVANVIPVAYQTETGRSEAPAVEDYVGQGEFTPYNEPMMSYGNPPWCAMCPYWYGWADGVIMFRDNQARDFALIEDVNTNVPLISSGDLSFGGASGIRAGLGARLHDRWSVEFQFLGGLNHVATADVSGTNNLALPGDLGLTVNNFYLADEASVRYESQINSPEINFVYCRCSCDPEICDSCELFGGFRYLELNEELGIRSYDIQESTSRYRVRTFNNLYGGQLGVRGRRARGRWSLESTCKAGVFVNQSSQVQDPIYDFPGIQFRGRRSSADNDTAFVGEVNLTAIFHIDTVWGIRGGYNAMWIEGVALAPDQLDFTNTPASGTGILTEGGVFLHGVNFGLEARY